MTSKILLGVFGVVPAYDRFFKEAAGFHGINKQFNENSFEQLQKFYNRFENQFTSFIKETATDILQYTPMKVIDMYFWKVGEILANAQGSVLAEELIKFISDLREVPQFVLEVKNTSVPKTGNQTEDIRNYIAVILQTEKESGQTSALICARDIHNALNLKNHYPSVCMAMGNVPSIQEIRCCVCTSKWEE